MCFYDSENMQKRFKEYVYDQDFFPNLNKLINYYIVLSFSVTKNIFAYKYAERVSNITKLLIQFVQALGEGFNKTYHNNIFKLQSQIPSKESEEEKNILNKGGESTSLDSSLEMSNNENNTIPEKDGSSSIEEENEEKLINDLLMIKTPVPDTEITRTIYESVIINLKRALFLLDLNNVVDCEMPYDKLIILITNLIDFLIEYIETEDDKKKIVKIKNPFIIL